MSAAAGNNPQLDVAFTDGLTRREAFRRLCLVGFGATAGLSLISACGDRPPSTRNRSTAIDATKFNWPPGLVAMWDFQDDPEGGQTVTSRIGETVTLTARDSKTVVKDDLDPGPFGPSLVVDGKTVFVKDGDIGGLDVTSDGGTQVTVVNWVNDVAGDHDDATNGISFRAGSHVEGGPESARQYGSYFDAIFYLGWSHGHYTPHIGAQDGPSPGYPSSHDYAGSARRYFTGVGQGRWHMEAFTYDGERIIAYVDGLADEWKNVPEPQPIEPGYTLRQTVDRNPYYLGKPINNSRTTKRFSIAGAIYGEAPYKGVNFTTGQFGGVAVFNRALTAAEIMGIRIGTLRPNEAITTYSFEVSTLGPRPLTDIGWTASAGASNVDVSAGVGDEYRVSRPSASPTAFLRKASPDIGVAWVPLSGLLSTTVKRVRFKLLSATPSSAPQRLLVQVGNRWWASSVAYGTNKPHPDDSNWAQAETAEIELSWSERHWKAVTLEPGVLNMDDNVNEAPIPEDAFTAIGFISEGGDGTIARITDLELLPT